MPTPTTPTTKSAAATTRAKATKTTKSKVAAKKLALEEMAPPERAAEEILMQFADLAPSVRKIMEADLSDTQRLRAITQFRNALTTAGDPNRDPRYSIAHCGPDDR